MMILQVLCMVCALAVISFVVFLVWDHSHESLTREHVRVYHTSTTEQASKGKNPMKIAENRKDASSIPFEEGTVTMTVDMLNDLLAIAALCRPSGCVRGRACKDHQLDSIGDMTREVYGNDCTAELSEYDLHCVREHFATQVEEAREF